MCFRWQIFGGYNKKSRLHGINSSGLIAEYLEFELSFASPKVITHVGRFHPPVGRFLQVLDLYNLTQLKIKK